MMEIKRLHSGDEGQLEKARACFDNAVQPEAAKRFLESDDHFILLAYDGDSVAGFVSGVALTHPDKGTEMFLYELAVNEQFRRRGIGTALVNALAECARERDCYGMWVLADDDNIAAHATYAASNGLRESRPVLFSWTFESGASTLRRAQGRLSSA